MRIAQRFVPHRGHNPFDFVVVALDSVRFGKDFCAITRCHGSVVGDRVDEPHRERGIAADQSEPGRPDEVVAGYPTAGVDSPQGDLDDVLPTPGAMRFHEVGQFLLDSPQSEAVEGPSGAPRRTAGEPDTAQCAARRSPV